MSVLKVRKVHTLEQKPEFTERSLSDRMNRDLPSAREMDEVLAEFQGLPEFKDGRINYKDSDRAPVLACFVRSGDRMLLVKRSENVGTHNGKWNNISGYIDERGPLEKTVLRELGEEIFGLTKTGPKELESVKGKIGRMLYGGKYERRDDDAKKTFIIFVVLVDLKGEPGSNITLNWENAEQKWVKPSEIAEHNVVPSTLESLKRIGKLSV